VHFFTRFFRYRLEYARETDAKENGEVRDKSFRIEEVPVVRKSRHMKRALFLLALGALAGYYLAFQLPEERRTRINKLLFESREMWFRIFV